MPDQEAKRDVLGPGIRNEAVPRRLEPQRPHRTARTLQHQPLRPSALDPLPLRASRRGHHSGGRLRPRPVADRELAFSEITRVLKSGGTLYVATNGGRTQSGMGWMQRILDPSRPADNYFGTTLDFSLENGAEQLSPWFSDVTLRRYEDALFVTEVDPLVEYLLSGSAADSAVRESTNDEFDRRVSNLVERMEQEMAREGTLHITKD